MNSIFEHREVTPIFKSNEMPPVLFGNVLEAWDSNDILRRLTGETSIWAAASTVESEPGDLVSRERHKTPPFFFYTILKLSPSDIATVRAVNVSRPLEFA